MLKQNLTKKSLTALAVMSAIAFSPASNAALATYSQNWESFVGPDLGDSFVIGNIDIDTGGAWFAGFAAPGNYNNGYSTVVSGEGDVAQGSNQLSIFSDYNPWSPFTGSGVNTLQTFVYRDNGTIAADDVGKTYRFGFDAKLGGFDAGSQAEAFVKVLKQSDASYFELVNNVFDSDSSLTTSWSGGFVDFTVDAGMVGELVQFGFNTTATEWAASTVFYDNLNFAEVSAVPVPAAVWLFGSGLLGLVGVARRRNS